MASRQPRYNLQVFRGARRLLTACLCAVTLVALRAQHETLPSARLLSAPRLVMPGAVDSNVPMTWELVDGGWRLFAFTSWGGIPALLTGSALDRMQRIGAVAVVPHPGYGVWIDSVIADDSGTWYGYHHHEVPADVCGTPERSIPRIASARSTDRGLTWEDLGIVLEAPPDRSACLSSNRYVIGGVGDLSAMLDPDRQDLLLYFSQYSKDPSAQGVAVARLAWADRDAPGGRVAIWQHGAWLPTRRVAGADEGRAGSWEYPAGTPLVPVSRP